MEFWYRIEDFIPPNPEERRMDDCRFSIYADTSIIKKVFATNIPKERLRTLENAGIEIAEKSGLGELAKSKRLYDFVKNSSGDETWLLHNVHAGGNACSLSVSHERGDYQWIVNGNFCRLKEGFVFYQATNCDNISQRNFLLSLWLQWAFFMEEILEK
ncbi:MAG TPA: hypothetical protein VJZ93_00100 [Candidatus Nanoarchaeia archaeon]|nr:hypothetical protein [Candidatus Nanoarchaeia archaeon]